jgi:hypothetical protein
MASAVLAAVPQVLDRCELCGWAADHEFQGCSPERFRDLVATGCLSAMLAAFSVVDVDAARPGEAMQWLFHLADKLAERVPKKALVQGAFTVLGTSTFSAQERLLATHVLATRVSRATLFTAAVEAMVHTKQDLFGGVLRQLASLCSVGDLGPCALQSRHAEDWCVLLRAGARTWGPTGTTLPWGAAGHASLPAATATLVRLLARWLEPDHGPDFRAGCAALLALESLTRLTGVCVEDVGVDWGPALVAGLAHVDAVGSTVPVAACSLLFTSLWRPLGLRSLCNRLGAAAVLTAALTKRVQLLVWDVVDAAGAPRDAHVAAAGDFAVVCLDVQWRSQVLDTVASPPCVGASKCVPACAADWNMLGVVAAAMLVGAQLPPQLAGLCTAWDLFRFAVACGAVDKQEGDPSPRGAFAAWGRVAVDGPSEDSVVLLCCLVSVAQLLADGNWEGVGETVSAISSVGSCLRAWRVLRAGVAQLTK